MLLEPFGKQAIGGGYDTFICVKILDTYLYKIFCVLPSYSLIVSFWNR